MGAGVDTQPVLGRGAAEEKAYEAERAIVRIRLVVVATGSIIYPFFVEKAGTIPWLAYALLGLAWVYGLGALLTEPYRRFPVLLSSAFTTVTDAAFTVLWLYATGGYTSPFFVALYPGVIAVAFRFPARATFFAAVAFAGAYIAMLLALDQIAGHETDVLVRVTYICLSALLGAVMSNEVQKQTAAKLELLNERHAQLEAAVQERERAVRARDDFLSAASHELRTPMTALQLHTDMLSRAIDRLAPETPGRAKVQAKVETANYHIQRLSKLIDNLLDISRITAGKLTLELEDVDLVEVTREVMGRHAEEAMHAGSSMTLKTCDSILGRWDRLRIDQVVTNLISNAIKYAAGKPITVTLERSGEVARLSVKDEGVGIAVADQARIFERFERAGANQQVQGFGLGLWIVRQIVEALDGTIRVSSQPGAGSTFFVELPVSKPVSRPLQPDSGAPAALSAS